MLSGSSGPLHTEGSNLNCPAATRARHENQLAIGLGIGHYLIYGGLGGEGIWQIPRPESEEAPAEEGGEKQRTRSMEFHGFHGAT